MDPKSQSAPERNYEDYEPVFQWESDQRSATLVVMLPGFRKEQLKVKVTSTAVVKINAERQISGNKWSRLNKEFPIPSDCDANEVSAKFERGLLYVKFPKLIAEQAPKPQEITAKPTQEAPPPKPREEKAEEAKANEVSEEKGTSQKEKEPSDAKVNEVSSEQKEKEPKEEGKREQKKKVRTDGAVEKVEAAATTSKEDDKKQGLVAKVVKRTKTRVLDFTPSLTPTGQDYNEGLEAAGLKKRKKLMNLIVVVLVTVVLGLYAKNAFRALSSLGGSKFQD